MKLRKENLHINVIKHITLKHMYNSFIQVKVCGTCINKHQILINIKTKGTN